jgi:membrane-associated protease RseP (regulator of RpoE activity)
MRVTPNGHGSRSGSAQWRHVLTALGVIGATVAVHEAAHAIAASRVGGKVKEIGVGFGPPLLRWRIRNVPVVLRAFPLGGYAAVDAETLPPLRRIPLLLAGPLANIVAGIPFLLAFRRHPVDMPASARGISLSGFGGTLGALIRAAERGPGSVARLAGAVNVGLGLMNLLPVYPLDGGHVALSVMEATGVPQTTRSAFARLTTAVFLFLAQAALLSDLRRASRGTTVR